MEWLVCSCKKSIFAKNKMKMKKRIVLYILGICLLMGCQENYKEKFSRLSERENDSCPRRIDSWTVMDSTQYDARHNVIHYYYTLSGQLDDVMYMKENSALLKIELKKAVHNLVETKDYVKHGTKFHIVYYSESKGNVLAEFSF